MVTLRGGGRAPQPGAKSLPSYLYWGREALVLSLPFPYASPRPVPEMWVQGQGQDKRCEDGVIRCRDKVRDREGALVWAEDRLASQIQA